MVNHFPSKKIVEQMRKDYPIGCRVELLHMGKDPYSMLKPGDQGTVRHVDDAGTIFVSWDCGSGLGVAYGEDSVRKIEVAEEKGETV